MYCVCQAVEAAGATVNEGNAFFDTVTIDLKGLGLSSTEVVNAAREKGECRQR